MSSRKPHNANAGYVAEIKSKHPQLPGHFVIYDRDASPSPGIDADDRWIVMHEPSSAMVSCSSLKTARAVMKSMAAGSNDFDFDQWSIREPIAGGRCPRCGAGAYGTSHQRCDHL